MKLLAVILNYRTSDLTIKSADAAVTALCALESTMDCDWELVIVDNDSQDNSFEEIQSSVADWQNISVVESGDNGGFGAGNNFAMRVALESASPPDYVYILNSDAFPAKDAIKKLLNHLESNSQVGIAGSYIHGTDGEPHVTAFRFPSILSEFETSMQLGLISRVLKNYIVPLGIPEHTRTVDWLAGASMLMRASVLQEIGLFDETFFLYFEETDLCKRSSGSGWRIDYVRDSHVAHIGSASTGMKTWQRTPKYWLDSRKHYFCKSHGRLYYHLATLTLVVGTAIWQIRRRIQNKPDVLAPQYLKDIALHWLTSK